MDRELKEMFTTYHNAIDPDRPPVETARELIRTGLSLAHESGITAALRVLAVARTRMLMFQRLAIFMKDFAAECDAQARQLEADMMSQAKIAAMEANAKIEQRGGAEPWRGESGGQR
jgi:hypothetical protein